GDRRLRLAVTVADADGRGQLLKALKPLTEGDGALVDVVASADKAQWVVRLDDGKLVLHEATKGAANLAGTRQFHSASVGAGPRAEWLRTSLRKIMRAEGLLAIAGKAEAQRGAAGEGQGARIKVELIRYRSTDDRNGDILTWPSGGQQLRAGDRIAFR